MGKRRNRSPEEEARRAKIRELLQESNIGSMADIQELFKETIAEFMENGLDADENLAGVAYYAADCLKQHFQRLIEAGCTAVICSHDLLAHATVIHCGECGIRVPEDFSVIGVDDIPLCRHTDPPLSSIRQNRVDLGRSAFYALSSQLAGIPVSNLTLHAELIRRESVGPPPIQEYRTAHLTADVEES